MIKELRPCVVQLDNNEMRAWFHCWDHRRQTVDTSPLRGGHSGGEIVITLGVVELENGQINEVYPSQIKFLDTQELEGTVNECR